MSLLLRMLLLVFLGGVLGVSGNALHPAGVPLRKPVFSLAEVGQCSLSEEGQAAPRPEAEPLPAGKATALSLQNRPDHPVLFGDLRTPEEYARGHVPGALHLPCSGPVGLMALDKIPPGAELVLYDRDGRSPELQTAAQTAVFRGVSKVYVLQGGFSAWLGEMQPAESGTCERCGLH